VERGGVGADTAAEVAMEEPSAMAVREG
jgi:hypothetical protein